MAPFKAKDTVNIGIAGRINQKVRNCLHISCSLYLQTVNYIAEQASEALHHLLENASLPTIEVISIRCHDVD